MISKESFNKEWIGNIAGVIICAIVFLASYNFTPEKWNILEKLLPGTILLFIVVVILTIDLYRYRKQKH